ncbi:molybdate transport system substrate-binding protein [Thalassobacillus cyri]|uniref:Molybdate transport system substrate-binding protein n=1 Tax=Thalassobacillus cyri TaxID=571932 RepID=A0A1H4GHG6_9BACI|nr:molybdate ABC transporter substrate-binding protein [Thalassobacillus cyri]SEB08947.1 molybdate transport system substrate-binding protein [Thalassobacillus cyri]
MTRNIIAVILGLLVLTGCQGDNQMGKPELRIAAASSLTGVMKQIETDFESQTDIQLTMNFGSSGTLAQQIEQGAPSDIYISASEYWMKEASDNGMMDEKSIASVMANRLVLAVNDSSDIVLKKLTTDAVSQIAIGDPKSVPAGMYAKQALESLGLWKDIQGKLVYGKNAQQVAAYVESGNVDTGFVYQSDMIKSNKLRAADEVNKDHHTAIIYPAGIVKESKQKEAAEEFLQYIHSEEAKQTIKEFGFEQ